MAARKPSPHRGEGGPKGRMRGRMRGASPPWAPSSVSLRSTASPWKGEAFLRRARRPGAPTSAPAEVVRRHEITHHVGRGLAPSAQSLPPSFASQMPPPSSEGGFLRGCSLWPPLTRADSPCQGADSPYQGEMSRSGRGDRELSSAARQKGEGGWPKARRRERPGAPIGALHNGFPLPGGRLPLSRGDVAQRQRG